MGYQNETSIVSAIASVVDQVSPEPFEVLVVTSGGDRSGDAVRAAFPDLKLVESAGRLLPGGARNAGVSAATGDIVAFLAADCIAEPGWVAARLAAHRAGHRVVAGAVTAAPTYRPSAWAFHFDLFGARLPGRHAGIVAHPDPAAHGLSFDRGVLDALGPFDATLRVGEDTDAGRRLADLGVPVWFEPRVRTSHPSPRNGWTMVADRYRRGTRFAQGSGDLRGVTPARALLAYPVLWAQHMARTLVSGWSGSRQQRIRLVISLPWVAAGRAASLAGWYRERLRVGVR
ncbi:MAG: hypothetical protein QOG30_2149 [Acidimicrobiaceae bacterium]